MALIKCPECGKENVSESAIACPVCGYPIREYFEEMQYNKSKERQNALQKLVVVLQEIEAKRMKDEMQDCATPLENGISGLTEFANKKEEKNKSKRWTIIIGLLICLFIVYKTCIVKTVDSGEGWKHQEIVWGTCEFLDCGNKATHRIAKGFYKENYCDECWELYGKNDFKALAGKDNTNNNLATVNETNAKICAVKAVEDKLKAPSTAEFCKYIEMDAQYLGDNKWSVKGYVDAENSFGTMIRCEWEVTLTVTENGFTNSSVVIYE